MGTSESRNGPVRAQQETPAHWDKRQPARATSFPGWGEQMARNALANSEMKPLSSGTLATPMLFAAFWY